ncbi:MAG TPA: hypothetical protein DGG95_15010 [Cytophagales bacterium]|nr:hypothetical protein [Cytophagales bacterium]
MIIGNFDPGMNDSIQYHNTTSYFPAPDTLGRKPGNSVFPDFAYYYVDAVTVIPATQTPPNYSPYVTPNQPVCTSGTSFNLQNVPFGATASWSVSPTTLFSSATQGNGAAAALVGASGHNGSATLTYTLSSICGSYPPVPPSISGQSVDPVPVWVGQPIINSISIDGNSGPYPLCSSGTNIPYTNMQFHNMVVSTSGQTTPSVTFTLNSNSGLVTGSQINPTTYQFISNAKTGTPNFTITADVGNACGDVQQCLYFSNSGPCTLPQITSVTVNGVSGYDCSTTFVNFASGTWYTIQVTDNTNTAVSFLISDASVQTQTISSTSIKIKPSATSTGFSVTASTSNICGSTSTCIWFGSSGPAPKAPIKNSSLSVYPNPASTTFSVQLTDSLSTGSALSQPIQLYLYNRMSQMVYSIQSWSKSTDIPVGSLPDDIYYLNVFYKNAVLQKQIVVKK